MPTSQNLTELCVCSISWARINKKQTNKKTEQAKNIIKSEVSTEIL